MKIGRILLHGLVFSWIILAAILGAYGIYYYLSPPNQVLFQAPVAALFSVAGFLVWSWIFSIPALRRFGVGRREIWWMFAAALLWVPLIFIPAHFFTQGYLTALGNILAIWLFMLPVGVAAILIARKWILREQMGVQ